MRTGIYTKAVLTVIAIMLSVLALKPFIQAQPAKAAGFYTAIPIGVGPY